MAYFEVNPTESILSSLIECFWVYQPDAQPTSQRILPDGCIDIIYPFPGICNRAFGSEMIPLVEPWIVGTMTQPVHSQLTASLDYLGIRFRPGGIFPFIKMPLHVFTNLSVSVNCIDSALGASIQDQLLPLPGWPQRFQQLQALLLRYLRHASYPVVPIGPVVQEIIREKGQISVPQLCSHTNLSQRQLERLFKLYVGISPKLLSRIIRFRHTKNLIKAAHTDSLMGLAFTNGYSDHAHLTKEFKEFSGLTPSAYLAQ